MSLRLDFYESGIGETIILTFPSGGVAVIDAHPSPTASRPSIEALAGGKKVHFACLTHPHEDHGLDLSKVFEAADVEKFWHTIDDVHRFIYSLEEVPSFNHPLNIWAQKIKAQRAACFYELYAKIAGQNISQKTLKDDLAVELIDGVSIHILSPNEDSKTKWLKAYRDIANSDAKLKKAKKTPNPNEISAVLGVQYGDCFALLGSDALRSSWDKIIPLYRTRKLPRYHLLKVPHHGAKNSFLFNPRGHRANYLDLADNRTKPAAVLFAGDLDHPHKDVMDELTRKSDVMAFHDVSNIRHVDPLGISHLSGVRSRGGRRQVIRHTIIVVFPCSGPMAVR